MSDGSRTGKRVTWAELFFDLVFVLGIIQVSTLLGQHHQWWGIGRALVMLVPIYITWVAATFQTNRLGTDRASERITMFGVGLCGLVMAISVPHAYAGAGRLFVLAFVAARLILTFRYLPTAGAELRRPFAMALAISGPLFVVGAFVQDSAREVVWAVAALVDLASPLVTRRLTMPLRYEGGHLSERFGLLALLALGESIIDIGLPLAEQPDVATAAELAAVLVAFVVAGGLWWCYFDAVNETIGSLLGRDLDRSILYHVLYGHLGLVASIVTVAVAFENMVLAPTTPLTLTHASLLFCGTAFFLVSISYMWWVGFGALHASRVAAVVLLLALLPLGTVLPAIVATALVAVVLVGLSAAEWRWWGAATSRRLRSPG